MIRLVFLLRRKPEFSREEFQSYWLGTHGPLVAGFADALNLRRYVQNHTLDSPLNQAMNRARGGAMEAEYDGVAELWWDSAEALDEATASAAGMEAGAALLADESRFIDLPNSPLHLAWEYPQVNPAGENLLAAPGSDLLKLYFPLRQQPDLTEEQAREYWHVQHGPLVRSHALAMGIRRYLQVHRAPLRFEEGLRASRGTVTPPYLGHAELWIEPDAEPDQAAREGNRAAVEDEGRFIDFRRSCLWICQEHNLVDRR
jgi:uncharacterized protein (TIGR02118 family)